MVLTINPTIDRVFRVMRNAFMVLLGLVIGLALMALGSWRFEYVFARTHHHEYHGSFVLAVMALTGAEVIFTIGLIVAIISGCGGFNSLRR